ncbi:MAG TPA: zinc-ribbon domain containing protein [Planctomycetota bacterium]|nr:zinc-ribbon domain containing protein [Planctomycetota bacterium]
MKKEGYRERRLRQRTERLEKRRRKLMSAMGVALPNLPPLPPPIPAGTVRVNPSALESNSSYVPPDFVRRGYYLDEEFTCQDCGKTEVWTAAQQKWWYEVAKGYIWTSAIRCRACRLKERKRREEARKIHLEGIAKKRAKSH